MAGTGWEVWQVVAAILVLIFSSITISGGVFAFYWKSKNADVQQRYQERIKEAERAHKVQLEEIKLRQQDRHDIRTAYDQRLIAIEERREAMEEKFQARVAEVNSRLGKLESFDEAMRMVMSSQSDFRNEVNVRFKEVSDRFDILIAKRESDMRSIGQRFDMVMNQIITQHNSSVLLPTKKKSFDPLDDNGSS